MTTPPALFSSFFLQNDAENEFQGRTLFVSTPFASMDPREDPLVCTDANVEYIGHSSPKVFDATVNQRNGCGTLNGHNSIKSGSLFTFCKSNSRNSRATNKQRIHKAVERQRRQEMKTLYCRLRSLLPEENIKGKRSISDQLLEAVGYIKHLQKKVQELTKKADDMRISNKRDMIFIKGVHHSQEKVCPGRSEAFPPVKINSLGSALHISTNTFKYQIVYSELLLVLKESGLDVVSAISTAINDKVFHTIHAKVLDLHSFESATLYNKLYHLIGEKMMQHA
eukprot:Gb_31175 [translate_table: standard]